jgi:hypothetical protein
MRTPRNSAVIAATFSRRIRALREHVAADTEIGIGGVRYKASEIVAAFQAILDAQAALVRSRAQVEVDLSARRAVEAKGAAFEFPLKTWVLNYLGASSQAATEFGYFAPKKATKSPDDVAKAVKRAAATRVARRTMGKKEKLKIKGSLEGPATSAPPASDDES